MTNQESKRYHDMWKDIQDKELKQKALDYAQRAQANIPEMFRNIDNFKKRYPDIAKTLTPEQEIELGAEMVSVQKGLPTKAQTAYDAQVIAVDKNRAAERQKLNGPLEQTILMLQSTGKDPEKVQRIREAIDDNNKRIEERFKYPDPPKGGIAGLLGSKTPAPAATPGAQKSKYYMTKDGKLVEAPNP
jgi:hypothetical protein